MRIGSFDGASVEYGRPSNVVHPRDNDITPTPAQAEADAAKAAANDLLADIRNSLRDPNAGKATVTIP